MAGYATQYRELTEAAERMRGEALLDHIPRIVQLADEHGDTSAATDWRWSLLLHADTLGRFDRVLATFGELMALYRSSRDYAYLRSDLLWHYKWLLETLLELPDVSVEELDAAFERMEAFYEEEGESLSPVYGLRFRAAAFMGKPDEADRWYRTWQACPPGNSDDCPACVTHAHVQALLNLDRVDAAIDAAEPIFNGEQQCDEVPAITFSRLLLPMVLTQRTTLAVRMFRHVRWQVRHTPKLLSHLADQLVFTQFTTMPQTARRLASLTLLRLATSIRGFDHFAASRAAWIWSSRRIKRGEPLNLPHRVWSALPADAGSGDDAALVEWLEGHMQTLANAFDARHQTERFHQQVEQAHQIVAM